jgi:hypothetical protein
MCAAGLLELAGDAHGVELIGRYERAYSQYFGMFCERAVRTEARQRYLLGELLPEVKEIASRLLERILGSDLMLSRPAAVEPRRRAIAAPARRVMNA